MNENQDNNLQNSVENSTPIESVEMPTPIEAQAPIDEPTPVETQAPVVEPTPISPTSVVEPTPVAPTPVVESTPVAPTPVVEPTPVAPTPVVEPTPVVTPTPVETPVAQPVASPVNPAPVTPPTNEKKSNPVLVVLLIIALLAVIGYGVYSYTDIFKPKSKNNENNSTVTTTTTVSSKNVEPTTLEEYLNVVSLSNNLSPMKILDGSYKKIDTEFLTRCKNDGDVISFESNGIKYDYTCQMTPNDKYDNKYYVYIKGKINDMYEFSYWNYDSTTIYEESMYLINDYLVLYLSYDKDNASYISFTNKNNEKVEFDLLNKTKDGFITPYISNGYIYMIVVDYDAMYHEDKFNCDIMKYKLNDVTSDETKLGSFEYSFD